MNMLRNPRAPKPRSLLLVLVALPFLLALPSSAQQAINIQEYYLPQPTLPYVSNPWTLSPGPDGAIWFTVSCADTACISNPENEAIGRITADGTITKYPLPFNGKPAFADGKGPYGITLGPDDALWFTEIRGNAIGRITTAGVITEYPLPFPGSSPYAITTGPDGALWFTFLDRGAIGRITTGGVITEYPWIPALGSDAADIVTGSDGALWFTGLNSNRIGRITTGGLITAYLTSPGCAPSGIVAGPDGALWFACFAGNTIARITTDGVLTEYSIPRADSGPVYITVGPDEALWFTEQKARQIGRVTTTGLFTEYGSGSLGGDPVAITSAPDGVWFGKLGYVAHITPADTIPPTISGLPAAGCALWPPNGKFVQVADVTAEDTGSGVAPGSLVVAVESSEPAPPGHPDWRITEDSGGLLVELRAARLGKSTGRVYTLTATAADRAGNVDDLQSPALCRTTVGGTSVKGESERVRLD